MSLERVLVGYRKNDRERLRILDEYGIESVAVADCASCGFPVYFVKSGQDAYRSRDPEVLCTICMELHRPEIMAEL